MKNFVRYQLPSIIWILLIFWLSSIKTLPHVTTPIISADKLAHISIYFVLCWFFHRAFLFQQSLPLFKKWSLLSAFILTCLYGYFDEVHQLFVPGRTYDYFDMLADAIGAFIYVILAVGVSRYKTRREGIS